MSYENTKNEHVLPLQFSSQRERLGQKKPSSALQEWQDKQISAKGSLSDGSEEEEQPHVQFFHARNGRFTQRDCEKNEDRNTIVETGIEPSCLTSHKRAEI